MREIIYEMIIIHTELFFGNEILELINSLKDILYKRIIEWKKS